MSKKSEKKTILVTKKKYSEYTRFTKEFDRLIKKYGLTDWSIYYRLVDFGNENQIASIAVLPDCCIGNANYNARGDCDQSPEVCARHEFSHLLTARLKKLAEDRSSTLSQIQLEDERIAQILEKNLT